MTDLSVVVLLGSSWDALETFSTRWREVVRCWADDARIAHLTVVDHPTLRRRALVRSRLVEELPSWLDGVRRLSVTVPVGPTAEATDRVGWWRAARALRRQLPPAQRQLIVAATPLAAPLLAGLRDAHTTTAFDGVDHWNLRRRFAHATERLDEGFEAGAHADAVSAVAQSLCDELTGLGAPAPVVIPNGVDAGALTSPREPSAPIALPDQPFAVYVGTLGGRLDLDLLLKTAEELDDVPIVAVGPATDDAAEQQVRSSRLHWVGRLPPDDLPWVLNRSACALLIYQDTGLFEAVDSMKLLQYVVGGIPVVSTPLPGLPKGVRVGVDAPSLATEIRAAVRQAPTGEPLYPDAKIPTWSEVADRLLSLYLER